MIGFTLREAGGVIILVAATLTALGVIWRWARKVQTSLEALSELPKIKQELAELRELTARNGTPDGGGDGGTH